MDLRTVLINSPVTRRSPHSRLAPPLGLAYVASALLMEGYDVSAVDFNVSGLNLARVDRIVEMEKPAVVGISAYTETYANALLIARRVKSKAPEAKIVLGGPHPTLLPVETLAEEAVDFVVVGEGEATMVELVHRLAQGAEEPGGIDGLGYKDRGIPRLNARRKLLHPDAVPYPARELFPLEFYRDKWNVLASRGSCPFRCPFCSASALWNGRHRARIPENVAKEVKMLRETYGAEYVFFADDIFTLNRGWVHELLGRLNALGYPLEWGCATRVDMVDEKLIAEMTASGCRAIQYGVESGAQKILDSVKGIKKGQVLNAVRASVKAGVEVACSFMVPFPEDTRATIKETTAFIKQLYQEGAKVLLSYTTPYPGTYFHEHAEELGIRLLSDRWEDFDAKHNIMETKHLSAREIDELVGEIAQEVGLIKSA